MACPPLQGEPDPQRPPPAPLATQRKPIAATLNAWERLLFGFVGLGLAVFMLWGTFAWLFLSGLALGRACGGSLVAGAGVGTVLGVVLGLAWTAVVSLLLTAIRRRGIRGRRWTIGPVLCLAIVAFGVIDEARTAPPTESIAARDCDLYE